MTKKFKTDYWNKKLSPCGEGVKHDQSKPAMDLIPPEHLEQIARALEFGRHKYGAWNWAGGLAWSRVYAALQRHLQQFWRGEDTDPESGLSHLAHAAACVAFLNHYARYKKDLDDRPKAFHKEGEDNGSSN